MRWNDVMRCDTNADGIFDFFSSYQSSAILEPRDEHLKDAGWIYQGKVPNQSAACFVDSTIQLITSRGAMKTEQVSTDIFYFVGSNTEVITPR